MFSAALFVIGFLAVFHSGDAVLTWTAPDAAGTSTSTIAEGSAVSITCTAASGTAPYVYTIGSQPGTDFTITSTSPDGVLSLATGNSLDYESTTSYTVEVVVVDTTPTTALTATYTLEITVTDINDNPPIFNPTSYSATVADAAVAATSVTTVTATDADGTATNNVITYSIISGDDTVSKFAFTGAILKVATGQTLSRATTSCYALVVNAIDSPATGKLTGTTTVSVCVGSASECPCSSATTIAASAISLFVALVMMIL